MNAYDMMAKEINRNDWSFSFHIFRHRFSEKMFSVSVVVVFICDDNFDEKISAIWFGTVTNPRLTLNTISL